MKIRIKLFASLRAGRFSEAELELPEGSAVAAALTQAQVPESEAAVIFVNSRHALPTSVLGNGDVLAVFPPVGGG
jgi:sulfur carrier protein